ncbi:DUF2971 domain-containing protein [Streptococcus sp. 20-1249]|uniref:DUF2971 domain-containing protein n=1 Tax=Streptococcus hepaticus TaxID=3349163 RepID=UPI003749A2E6
MGSKNRKHQLKQESKVENQKLVSLVTQSNNSSSIEELSRISEDAQKLCENKKSIDNAIQYAKILLNLSAKQTEEGSSQSTAEKVKALYDKFNDSADIAESYAIALRNLSNQQTDESSRQATVDKLSAIYDKFKDFDTVSEFIAQRYAASLVNLSAKQANEEARRSTSEKVKALYDKFNDSADIAESYAIALRNLSIQQLDEPSRQSTVDKLGAIYDKFKDFDTVSESITQQYAASLVSLSVKQANEEARRSTSEKVKALYDKFNDSADMGESYAIALRNLSIQQTDKSSLQATVDTLSAIYDKFKDSDKVSDSIAEQYAVSLVNLSVKQSTQSAEKSIDIIFGILENNPVASILENGIKALTNLGLKEYPDNDNKDVSIAVAKALDSHFYSKYVPKKNKIKLITDAVKYNLVGRTKYELQKDWINKYSNDKDKLEKILDIYLQVQMVKYLLAMKKFPENLKVGHYTSGKVLQILLKQNNELYDEKKYIIKGKTRLSNANYMNDPEEGKVLDKVLASKILDGIKSNDLEPSSWFLMSFTTETDDLAMWSQYGNDAEGVCLVLDNATFTLAKDLASIEWKQSITAENIDISQSKKSLSEESSVEENDLVSKKGDYLYRICYIDCLSEGRVSLSKTELFENKELEQLKKYIDELKGMLEECEQYHDHNFKNDINMCLEEIRYLFKSSDYKYESELRILKYASLEPNNASIRIDNTQEIARLYLERDDVLKLEGIVFGPKFKNPEYVTPLIKLLDKNIKYKKSEKKFR